MNGTDILDKPAQQHSLPPHRPCDAHSFNIRSPTWQRLSDNNARFLDKASVSVSSRSARPSFSRVERFYEPQDLACYVRDRCAGDNVAVFRRHSTDQALHSNTITLATHLQSDSYSPGDIFPACEQLSNTPHLAQLNRTHTLASTMNPSQRTPFIPSRLHYC